MASSHEEDVFGAHLANGSSELVSIDILAGHGPPFLVVAHMRPLRICSTSRRPRRMDPSWILKLG
jgi:hypothetical protein